MQQRAAFCVNCCTVLAFVRWHPLHHVQPANALKFKRMSVQSRSRIKRTHVTSHWGNGRMWIRHRACMACGQGGLTCRFFCAKKQQHICTPQRAKRSEWKMPKSFLISTPLTDWLNPFRGSRITDRFVSGKANYASDVIRTLLSSGVEREVNELCVCRASVLPSCTHQKWTKNRLQLIFSYKLLSKSHFGLIHKWRHKHSIV